MKENIAKWYRSAGIVPVGDIVEVRSQGINYYVDKLMDDEDILELIKLFFGYECERQVLKNFVSAFFEFDNTFADDQINEIRVLAGVVLYKLVIEDECKEAIAIAIYIKGYLFLGKEALVREICDIILKYYIDKTSATREKLSFEAKKVSGLGKDITFAVEEGTEIFDVDVTNKLDSLTKKVRDIIININALYRETIEREKVLYEDSQILWWLMAEYSDDENKTYCELDVCKAAMLAGKDLASKILLPPGPYAAKSVLNKILAEFQNEDKMSFKEYINACDDVVIDEIIGECETTTPVLFALQTKKECGEEGWSKAFGKKFVDGDRKYSAIEIAYQIYLECLLLMYNG